MRKIIYTILLLAGSVNFGCKTNDDNLNIRVQDSETGYSYDATYPVIKTEKLRRYIAKEINSELPLKQQVDGMMNLAGGQRFKLKAKEGVLSIQFDKQNGSVTGYINIKRLTNGISGILKEN